MGILKSQQPAWNKGKKCPQWAGNKHGYWKGGRTTDKYGYVYVYKPNHPNAIHGRYVLEHRLVIEKHIGRHLNKEDIVHHINKIKNDNRLDNLVIVSKKDHQRIHHKNILRLKPKKCEFCKEYFQPVWSKRRFCSLSCVSNYRHYGKTRI